MAAAVGGVLGIGGLMAAVVGVPGFGGRRQVHLRHDLQGQRCRRRGELLQHVHELCGVLVGDEVREWAPDFRLPEVARKHGHKHAAELTQSSGGVNGAASGAASIVTPNSLLLAAKATKRASRGRNRACQWGTIKP